MQGWNGWWGWLKRRSPRTLDAGLAAALAAIAGAEIAASDCPCMSRSDAWWSMAFSLAATLPLVLRRRHPFAVLATVGTVVAAYNIINIPPDAYTVIFAVVVAVYSVAAHARRDLAVVGAVATLMALIVINLPVMPDDNNFTDVINQVLLLGGAWIGGLNTRYRRRQTELLDEQAVQAEQRQRERDHLATLQERSRLGREIHDVIAHSVSVIAVQAGAARAIAEQRPDRAREALSAIEKVSKETLIELRRALGTLRSPDHQAALRPPRRLSMLDELVEQVQQAGVAVTVVEEGQRRDLPADVDLSLYRIVQEALTNTIKHAGSPTAHVTIRYEPKSLEVVITDEGRGSAAGLTDGAGHGLLGMRQRVAMLGGQFEAAATESGYAVRACIPLTEDVRGR